MTISLKKSIIGFNNRLLASACRMNRISSKEMALELKETLLDFAGILSADHVVLSTFSPEENNWTEAISHPTSGPLSSITKQFPSHFPILLEKTDNGDAIVLHNLPGGLPPDAKLERNIVEAFDVRSILALPVTVGNAVSHMLSVFYLKKSCPLESSVLSDLQPAADFLASAHDRYQESLEHEKMTRFETLLDEISSSYINIPVDAIDRTVTQDLERLSRLMGADRYNILIHEESRKDHSSLFFSYTAGPENDLENFREGDKWIMAHGGHDLFRHINEYCLQGQHHMLYDIEELPGTEKVLKQAMNKLGIKSHLAVPISVNREVIGLMIILTTREHRFWSEALIRKVSQFGDLFANAYVRKRSEEARRLAHEEIQRLKNRLESDYRYLSDEFKKTIGGEIVLGDSPAMVRIMEQVMQVAPTQTPVLLLGETGVGKGMLAMALHQASRRAGRPLVQLNCATLAPGLIESELFGHERGAFTGADRQRAGRFEIAEGTTLFLDEIGELSPELQAKLLRVLETGEFERLGGSKTLKTDSRIIAATNRDLEAEVAAGRFRKDLWYRLSIFPIRIPPLRERTEDIPAIVETFAFRFSKYAGKHFDPISPAVMEAMVQYPWPGNVRELKNLIERSVIVSPDKELCITVPSPPEGSAAPFPMDKVRPFAEMERSYLLHALKQADWRIEGVGGAADILSLNPSTLRSRMRKLGIRKTTSRFE
jgi:transcriptional regulator with GAF, ATPase, and Fis domain